MQLRVVYIDIYIKIERTLFKLIHTHFKVYFRHGNSWLSVLQLSLIWEQRTEMSVPCPTDSRANSKTTHALTADCISKHQ